MKSILLIFSFFAFACYPKNNKHIVNKVEGIKDTISNISAEFVEESYNIDSIREKAFAIAKEAVKNKLKLSPKAEFGE